MVLAGCLITASVQATPIYVDPTTDGSYVEFRINDSKCSRFAPCGIEGVISDSLDGPGYWLNAGDSWTFDFFDVYVGGFGVVRDFSVEAVLAFLSPDIMPAASGNGSFFTLFGLVSGGTLYWEQPDAIQLDDGSWLHVTFENVKELGFGNHTTVSATASRYYVAVPEPGTLALFGLSLIGLWFVRRNRTKTDG